ncbi:hypothetical protein LTR70_009478 [Exophiala xenobiotica]|uniref:Uncharacterized protein n=1 Tax=Lithohypha guttulata TaxID=1690604 RepID=A0ABR0JXC7_9EURO|nr:hypothetical protein LTR24_009374 [Lithohypha guttulata]KAK5310454.1 hypothetical protein LTR70_009478 [Exophiala xenobiotica]
MNDTISTFDFLSARISEHLTAQNTEYWANLEYQYNTATLVLVDVPLLVALAILLRDLSINSITRAEIQSHQPSPELRAQIQSHQSVRPTAPHCSNIAKQTITTESPPTSSISQEEHDHQRVGKLKDEYIQQRAEWIAEREGLRSQLLQARGRSELLLKANQIEIRTRAGGKFLAALEVVCVQEDIAIFSAREKRKTEAFKKKLQLEYDQRLEQITIAKSATANAERKIRMQAEEEARVLTEQRDREGQQLAQMSSRLQELESRYSAQEQEHSTELTQVRNQLAVASQQRDKLLGKQEETPEAVEPVCAGFGFGMRRASSAILSPSQPIDSALQQPRIDPSTVSDKSQQAPSRQPNSFQPPVDISSDEEEAVEIQVPSSPPTSTLI